MILSLFHVINCVLFCLLTSLTGYASSEIIKPPLGAHLQQAATHTVSAKNYPLLAPHIPVLALQSLIASYLPDTIQVVNTYENTDKNIPSLVNHTALYSADQYIVHNSADQLLIASLCAHPVDYKQTESIKLKGVNNPDLLFCQSANTQYLCYIALIHDNYHLIILKKNNNNKYQEIQNISVSSDVTHLTISADGTYLALSIQDKEVSNFHIPEFSIKFFKLNNYTYQEKTDFSLQENGELKQLFFITDNQLLVGIDTRTTDIASSHQISKRKCIIRRYTISDQEIVLKNNIKHDGKITTLHFIAHSQETICSLHSDKNHFIVYDLNKVQNKPLYRDGRNVLEERFWTAGRISSSPHGMYIAIIYQNYVIIFKKNNIQYKKLCDYQAHEHYIQAAHFISHDRLAVQTQKKLIILELPSEIHE
jgi:hypothetical protein